uniref:Integrase catalytic domain-containing protein n=1 Tax=Tanacetum cinerariifolium TaxID=118510 RepID=A0A6L2KHP2_TANCI|nr:hypothetical protein [Tanacetum cinerariifolium]
MGDENTICTLRDYSKPSHEGYKYTIELPVGNNVVPLRSDTIRLVQNGCSFHGLRSEDPNQHLKDFLKLVDSLDLNSENRERTRLEKEVEEETEGETKVEEKDNLEHFDTFPTMKELRVKGLKVFVKYFTYECGFMVLEDMTTVIDHYLGSVVFEKSFVEAIGLVYNKEEGTVVFERDKEEIVFKMPHKINMFKHIDFADISTDRIPPFIIESDDDNREKTHYSNNLDLRLEYKYDEYVCRGIRSLMAAKSQEEEQRRSHIRTNKSDLDTMSIDDIYNNFKILEQESSSTSEVPTAYEVSTAASIKVSTANLSDATVNGFEVPSSTIKHEGKESYIVEDEVPTNIDLLAFLESEVSKNPDKLIGSQITNKSRKGVRFDSYNVVPSPPTRLSLPLKIDLSYSGLEEFKQPKFQSYGPKSCETKSKNASKDIPNELKESPDAPLVKDKVSDNKDCSVESLVVVEKKTVVPTVTKIEFVKSKQQEKLVRKLVKYVEMYKSQGPRGNQRNWNNPKSQQLGRKGWNMAPRAVLMKTGLRPLNTARLRPVNNVRPRPVNTVRPNSSVVNVVRMCDKKKNVLFTNTECLVLSPNFKLPDENQILLRVPRRNNMYSVDMKNIVPKKSLTCLVAKATLDESMIWHRRLATKDETPCILKKFITEIENLVDKKVKVFRCDNGTEFKNSVMNDFCAMKDVRREFSVARTPQQNGVAERRNRTLIEAARTMVLVVKPHNKTPYELFRGTKENIGKGHSSKETGTSQDYMLMPLWKYSSLFDSSSKNTTNDEPQSSYDARNKDDNGVNKDSEIDARENSANSINDVNNVWPSINTASTGFDTVSLNINTVSPTVSTTLPEATHADFLGDKPERDISNINTIYQVPSTPNIIIHKDYSLDLVIGDVQSGVLTKKMIKTTYEQGFISIVYKEKTHKDLNTCLFACFLSQIEPTRVAKSLIDPAWAIVTKWVFKNKKDERGIVIKNKARLVSQGYTQEEGIDYDEVFAHVARIEAIRLFLAYASFIGFIVYQMDMKSAFFYGRIKEEVYVCQPLGFEDLAYPDKVYKMVKALYGLYQAPIAWYETLAKYLLDNEFHRGKIDQTLFIKRQNGDILLAHVYVDDIIFGSTKKELCNKFERLMKDKFHMSSIGELTFFLGLQVKQKEDRIFISQDKYVTKVLRKFNLSDVKTASTLVDTEKPLVKEADVMIFQVTPMVSHLHAIKRIFRYLKRHIKFILWYPKDSPFELVAYTDSDYARASLDRKSTSGGCKFLGSRLISWQCKNQTVVATSITKAEYVATASYRRQKTVKSTKARRRAKIIVSDDEDAAEDTLKQGRKIDAIDQDPDISLVQHDAERSASKDKGKGIMTESEPEQTTTKLQQRQERDSYEAAVRLQEQLDEEERERNGYFMLIEKEYPLSKGIMTLMLKVKEDEVFGSILSAQMTVTPTPKWELLEYGSWFRMLYDSKYVSLLETQESKVDTGKALDTGLVVTNNSGTESKKHDTSSTFGNDTNVEDADNKLVNDKEPMVKTKDHNDSLIAQLNSKTIENVDLKAQIQEKVFANATLKNKLRRLKGNSVDRHRFSLNKYSVVHEKPSLRTCLRWKPTCRIFKTIDLRWIPTGKLFAYSTTKVDSEPPHEALLESSWIDVMQEEIHEFERLDVWELVPCPDLPMVIKLKLVFKVKQDEFGEVLKNKARLVAKGYFQEEGINFEESFAPVVHIEAIKIFVANTTNKNMTIYQMDVKITFLNDELRKEVYTKYALEILKKYGIDSSDLVDTPMVNQTKLDEDLQGTPIDATRYRVMIESLMYLTLSRLDLVFSLMHMRITPGVKTQEEVLLAVPSSYASSLVPTALFRSLFPFLITSQNGCQDNIGELSEKVYVSQPEGFIDLDNPTHVYKLKKSIYGLKQVPRAWYNMLPSFLLSQKFSKGVVDHILFTRNEGKDILMTKYALEILKKYGMDFSDLVDTPMDDRTKLDKDLQGTPVDATHYCVMIGSLMYLTLSRHGLVLAVCMCARTPKPIRHALSTSTKPPRKGRGKGKDLMSKKVATPVLEKKKNVPIKKGSITAEENILFDSDEALKEQASEVDKEAVERQKKKKMKGIATDNRFPKAQVKDLVLNWRFLMSQNDEPKGKFAGSSEGAGITPEFSDKPKGKYAAHDKNDDDWGSHEEEVILSSDDERTEPKREVVESDKADDETADDKEIVNLEKFDTRKSKEEKYDNEQTGDDQAKDAQAEDDQTGTFISMTHKKKPEFLPLSSSLSLSSDYDVQVQQEIPHVQQAPLLDVLVLVIPTMTTPTPSTTPPKTEIQATTITATDPSPTVLLRLFKLERKVEALSKIDHSELIEESVQANTPAFLAQSSSTSGQSLSKAADIKSYTIALLNSMCLDDAIASGEVNPEKVLRKRHHDEDQDPPTGSNKEKKRSRKGKDFDPSKKSSKSRPLPLQGSPCHLTIPVDFLLNNDLEYLRTENTKRKYMSLITKTKAVRYELEGIEDMIPSLWRPVKVAYDRNAELGICQWGPKQSYQKKLNITKPQKDFLRISFKEPHTTTYDPKGVVYQNKRQHKRLTRADELYKFYDEMLKSVCKILHERLQDFKLGSCEAWKDWLVEGMLRQSIDYCSGQLFTLTMKILPVPTSNKHCGRGLNTSSWKSCQGDSSKLNLPDHRPVLTELEVVVPHYSRVEFRATCSYSIDEYKDMMKAQVHVTQVFCYSDTQTSSLKSYSDQDKAFQRRLFNGFLDEEGVSMLRWLVATDARSHGASYSVVRQRKGTAGGVGAMPPASVPKPLMGGARDGKKPELDEEIQNPN